MAGTAQARLCPPYAVIARSTSRLSSADTLKTLLDGGEPAVDERLELGIGENIRPVVLNGLPNQFADVERIDAGGYPFLNHLETLGVWPLRRPIFDSAGEPLRNIAP